MEVKGVMGSRDGMRVMRSEVMVGQGWGEIAEECGNAGVRGEGEWK